MSGVRTPSRAVEDNDFRMSVLHGILARKAANKDLYATSALFPFLEKTKIELINGRWEAETDSDKYRPVLTRTLKKSRIRRQIPTRSDKGRQQRALLLSTS